jgi:hypothetical protein
VSTQPSAHPENEAPEQSSPADRIAVALCLAAIAYCICGATFSLHRVTIDITPVPQADPTEPEISGAGFARNKLYPYTVTPPYTGSVKLFGSWSKPVLSPGLAHSAWYKPAAHFAIFFAGYPNRLKNQLFLEIETAKAGIVRLPVPPELIPGEAWWLKGFSLPEKKQPLRFRIVGVAVPLDSQGWLGFSQPFTIRSVDNVEICKQLFWVLLTAAASIVAYLAPGFILRRTWPNLHFIWIPVAGIVPLALIGLAAWIGPAVISPRIICRTGLFLLIGFGTYNFVRFPLSTYTTRVERQTLLILLLLVSIATAKTIYSLGPTGELYAGRVSRTYEVGARSDSRFLYHAIQLIRFRESVSGAYAAGLYSPWSFSHRGPIAGLAAAPIMLAPRVNVVRSMPDQAWSLFDIEGFEAYRTAMIVLACCGLLTVFGLARVFLPPDWAFFAFLIAATAPFSIHEIYYTWPKLPAAGCVLIAAYLAFRRKYLLSGLALGFAYLVHPSALLSAPALIGIAILHAPKKAKRYGWIEAVFALALGIGAWLVLWRLINQGHYAQDTFMSYFKLTAGLKPPTVANWFRSRIASMLNTLVPMNLIVFHRRSLELQSIYSFSPPVIQFFFVYWNTLPFGAGIAFFFVALLRLVYLGFQKMRAWLIVLFVIPFAIFVPYWGWSLGGLMREGLHAWFLGLMIFIVVIWRRFLRGSNLFFRLVNWTLLFRSIEMLCVLVVPTIFSQNMIVQQPWVLSDTVALAAMFAATLSLYTYTFRFAEALRRRIAGGRSA